MKPGGLRASTAHVERAEKPAAPSVNPAVFKKSRRCVFMIESNVSRSVRPLGSSGSGQGIARFGGRQLRNLEPFSILAFEMLVRFAVLEALSLGIEFQGTAQPVGDVAELAVDAGEVRVERGHRLVFWLARANGSEETLPLAALVRLGGIFRHRNRLALGGLAFLVGVKSFAHDIHSFRAEEGVAAVSAVAFPEP